MHVYFVAFAIEPEIGNSSFPGITSGLAYCWVKATDSISANRLAAYKVQQYGLRISDVSIKAQAVTESDYEEGTNGHIAFKKAMNNGMAIDFLGITDNADHPPEQRVIELPNDIDLNRMLTSSKGRRNKGECLFPTREETRCGTAIGSHSMQKMGVLSQIAVNGEVMVPDVNIGSVRKSGGMVQFCRKGISKVSVFRGFCSLHDNSLFAPIDDKPFESCHQQAMLYAYRAVCMELVAKRNLQSALIQNSRSAVSSATRKMIDAFSESTASTLSDLEREKELYDKAILCNEWNNVRYVAFLSKDLPTMVFSGLLSPCFGFGGEILLNPKSNFSFLSVSFAPTSSGWATVFAWHENSHSVSSEFVRTLAQAHHQGAKPEDAIFRMLVKMCENIAISPCWWDSLSSEQRMLVCEAASVGAGPFSVISRNYLVSGLEGIISWGIDSVVDAS